jgi:hypothetical protein
MIKNSTEQIILLKRQLTEIKRMIEKLTKNNKSVKTLEKYRGIGIMTASTLTAEIVDIRRFVKDDNLASYAGLGKHEYKTGNNEKEIPNCFFNRRLKNAFMTAARNYVLFNPDSHLAGYYRNLVKGGMKKTEARKRAARALVRVFFRDLYSLVEPDDPDKVAHVKREKESDMTNVLSRSDKDHSNIPLSFPISNNTEESEKIKGEKTKKAVLM